MNFTQNEGLMSDHRRTSAGRLTGGALRFPEGYSSSATPEWDS